VAKTPTLSPFHGFDMWSYSQSFDSFQIATFCKEKYRIFLADVRHDDYLHDRQSTSVPEYRHWWTVDRLILFRSPSMIGRRGTSSRKIEEEFSWQSGKSLCQLNDIFESHVSLSRATPLT
jgi:hypothetical protein